jgi:hypothetical protein
MAGELISLQTYIKNQTMHHRFIAHALPWNSVSSSDVIRYSAGSIQEKELSRFHVSNRSPVVAGISRGGEIEHISPYGYCRLALAYTSSLKKWDESDSNQRAKARRFWALAIPVVCRVDRFVPEFTEASVPRRIGVREFRAGSGFVLDSAIRCSLGLAAWL